MTVHASARLDRGVENIIMAREQAGRYQLATGPGASVAERLDALKLLGWRVLLDRRWIGSKRTTIDALLVGPGGVVVADVREWQDVQVVDGSVLFGADCRDEETALLRGVTDRVEESLRGLGVTRQALRSVWIFAGQRLDDYAQQVHLVGEANLATWLSALTARLEDADIDALAAVLERDFVAYDASSPLAARSQAGHVGGGAALGLAAALDVESLATALTTTAMATPVERWMTFLAAEQLPLVTASWDGPSRITGPAGSGKTVVGLHRAAHLASRHREPVLFVAPTAALPTIAEGLAARLAPFTHGRIVFTSLVDLALGLVEQTGTRPRLDEREVSVAFRAAWTSADGAGVLSRVDQRAAFWQDEVDHVIKGRGITELADYLALPRTGLRTVLDPPVREAVWSLYAEYQRRLTAAGQGDANDVLAQARDLVLEGLVAADYSAVVVDDAEDVSLVGLQLLRAIAGDGPDRLLLLDDGRQAVHTGGGTPAEAGIDVADRVSVLRDNRRCSADLLGLADVVAGDSYTDLDGTVRQHGSGVALRRRGPAADVVEETDRAALDAALLARLVEMADRPGGGYGGLAVLVHTDYDLAHLRNVLTGASLPVVDVDDYDGTTDRVVVGTFDRAKGLEFDHVLMPGLCHEPVAQPGEHDEAHRERVQRRRTERYVGMTRARHGLWLGYLGVA